MSKLLYITIGLMILVSCNPQNPNDSQKQQMLWEALNAGLSDLHVQALALDPNDEQVLYAGTFDGISKTTNAGAAWHTANTGLTSKDVKVLVCNPQNSNQIFAGTWGAGIFRSDDAASTWVPINKGITDLRIRSIRINPNNPKHVYALSDGELLESANSGMNWTSHAVPVGNFFSFAIDFQRNIAYAATEFHGIYKTTNGGETWEKIPSDIFSSGSFIYGAAAMEYIAGEPGTLLVAIVNKGIYLSRDEGKNWSPKNQGLSQFAIQSLAVLRNPSSSRAGEQLRLAVLGTKSSLFLSEDISQAWRQIDAGLNNPDVRAIAISRDAKVIFVGVFGSGVFKTGIE